MHRSGVSSNPFEVAERLEGSRTSGYLALAVRRTWQQRVERRRGITAHVTPKVMFSRCLGFERCRYNGQTIIDPVVEHIKTFVDPITACPEMEIGLGVPRPPVRLIGQGDDVRLVQPETDRDVTSQMAEFTDRFLETLTDVDGFILKYRSPSCGQSQVKVYNSSKPGAGHQQGAGAFGGQVVKRFGELAIEDEGRLRNFDIRQHFLTKLFTLARFREISQKPSMRVLVSFHACHKFLLMAYNQAELRAMGRIVANQDRLSVNDVVRDYRKHLVRALGKAPRRTSAINVLMHAFGYVSDKLTSREKAFFLDSLAEYRARHVPLSAPASVIRSWIVRFEVNYLQDQIYLEPFPQELTEVLDSGKGRTTH